MIYERIGSRYMEIVNPAMYSEIMNGMTRGGARMKCLNYVMNGDWLQE